MLIIQRTKNINEREQLLWAIGYADVKHEVFFLKKQFLDILSLFNTVNSRETIVNDKKNLLLLIKLVSFLLHIIFDHKVHTVCPFSRLLKAVQLVYPSLC